MDQLDGAILSINTRPRMDDPARAFLCLASTQSTTDLTGSCDPQKRMSDTQNLATATAPGASSEAKQEASWSRVTGSASGAAQNLSKDMLAADLAQRSRARKSAATAAQPKTGDQPKPTQSQESAEAPTETLEAATDNSQATSLPASADESEVESNAATEGAAENGEVGDGASEDQETAKESKAIRDMRKRIAKLTARNKDLEAKLNAPATKTPDAATQQGSSELSAIDEQIAIHEAHLSWFDQNPEGGTYKDADGRVVAEVPPERIPLLRRQTERRIAELQGSRAAKQERLEAEAKAERQRQDAEAIQAFPWLNDAEAPEFQEAQELLATLPMTAVRSLEALPNARKLLAYAVLGKRSVASAAKPASSQRPTPPKVFSAAASAAPRSNPGDAVRRELAEAEAAYEKSGRQTDYTRVLKLQRQIARSQSKP